MSRYPALAGAGKIIMKKILLLVCLVLLVASCGNQKGDQLSTIPSAIVTKDAAVFWFPVESASQKWQWGISEANELEYAWKVQINIMGERYQMGYTKWQSLGSKGSGSLKKLLFNGQVDIWKLKSDGPGASSVSRQTPDSKYLEAFQKGNGISIELAEPKFLGAIRSERPKNVVFITSGAQLKYKEETIDITYKD